MQEEAKPHAPEAAAAQRAPPNQIAVDTHSSRRTDIDGLRAVAAAAVVLNHIDSAWLALGSQLDISSDL